MLTNYIPRTEGKADTKADYDEIVETILDDKVIRLKSILISIVEELLPTHIAYCFPLG